MSALHGDTAKDVSGNRQLFLSELGVNEARLARAVQVSRANVKIVDKPGKYDNCDALITKGNKVFLSILTADCAPILIWSVEHRLVAAVHSGWQGSELDILGRTIQKINNTLHIGSQSLFMVIGPGLSQKNFEVGPEFKQKFQSKYIQNIAQDDRLFFNNNQHLMDTAVKYGVPVDQIEVLPYCSFEQEDLFFSHRRDRGHTGRMMSVIGIKE